MTKIIAILLLLSALPLMGWRTDAQQKALVLTHLTIIDITGGPPKPERRDWDSPDVWQFRLAPVA
jgi:hypothetical protein